MDGEDFRKAGYAAIDEICKYYETLPARKVVSDVEPGYLASLLPTSIPDHGEPWSQIQSDIEDKIVPGLTHWQHPNFLAFFPANATFPGILGDMYSTAFTCAAFNWICSPAVTELETIVLDWLARALALPSCYLSAGHGGGVIQGSASEAIVTVMVAARDRYLARFGEDRRKKAEARGRLMAFGSEMTHSSTLKAALICGVEYRTIPVEEGTWRLRGKALKKAMDEAREEGWIPFFLTATIGTTATCAVDAVDEIAEWKQQQQEGNDHVWIHVDAAYAGAALILSEYQHLTPPLAHFDSFDMNMHKWLLTPFDASCLFVRERKHLIDALSVTPSYLRNKASESGRVIDYRDWQVPLGRRFRGLKVWFVMRTYGLTGLQEHIRRTMELGQGFAKNIRTRDDLFEIVAPPAYALTVFTVRSPNPEVMSDNEVTKKVYESINMDGEFFLTHSVVGGRDVIRVVGGSPQLRKEHLDRCFEVVAKFAEEVRKEVTENMPN
ncbi:hypothetical protein YB2330_005372 [Saitoella coloradoensis]